MKLFVLVFASRCILMDHICIARDIYGIARDESDVLCNVSEIHNIPIANKNAESIYKGYTLNTTLHALFNPIPYIITKDTIVKVIH